MKKFTSILLIFWTSLMGWLLLTPSNPNITYHLFEGEDKVAHVVLFAVWSFLLTVRGLYARMSVRIMVIYAAIISLLAAIGTELLQELIPYRSRDLMDFVADSVGAVLGILMAFLTNKYFFKAKKWELR